MEAIEDLENFIYELASEKPIPGGGSASAVAASIGAALSSMVLNFTLGKKKYEDYQSECSQHLEIISQNIRKLLDLAEKDTQVYTLVQNAFVLPKNNEDEKKIRSLAIANACEKSLMVPLEIMKVVGQTSQSLEIISNFTNQNLDSDTAGAAAILSGAASTAWYCAWSNLPFINNETKKSNIKTTINDLKLDIESNCAKVLERVKTRMNITTD